MQTPDRALVILGRNSFIGRNIEQHVRTEGVQNIVAVSSAECDLANPEAVQRLFQSVSHFESTVLFLAAVNKWQENSFAGFLKNVSMVQNVIEALPASTAALIYFSSADVYGLKPALPIKESSATKPDSWYGMAKHVAEWMLFTTARIPCPITILRLPGVYGATVNDRSVIGRFADTLRQQTAVELTGEGRVRRDYVYVQDVCRLVQELVERKYHGVLNVATGESVTLRDIVSVLAEALGAPGRISYGAVEAERDFDMEFDNSLLRAVLPNFNFTPFSVAARCYAAN